MPRLRLFLLVSLMSLVAVFAIAQDSETKSIRVASPNEQIVVILSTGPAQPEPAPGPPGQLSTAYGMRWSSTVRGSSKIRRWA